MTFLLSDDAPVFATVFRNGTLDELMRSMNKGFQTDDRILVVPHLEDFRRSISDAHRSAVTPHPIVPAQALTPDRLATDDGRLVPAAGHKFGGEPYCIQEPELPGAGELFDTGYLQVIQVDFPGPDDEGVGGSWPFLDGMFNLFWKPPFFGIPCHWYFQK